MLAVGGRLARTLAVRAPAAFLRPSLPANIWHTSKVTGTLRRHPVWPSHLFQRSAQTFSASTGGADGTEKPTTKLDDINLKDFPASRIRNFCIIAHIDHGKTTLSDRIIDMTATAVLSKKSAQFLDRLQVERERGITVKAHTVSLFYKHNGETYLFNLIDTPGHVDFNYEVSRSLAACQGAVLVVDAAQGVQAQTIANFYLAFEAGLDLIPVLNKIDLPAADIPRVMKEMESTFSFLPDEILKVSAKTGLNVSQILESVLLNVRPPTGATDRPFKGLLFDNWYDRHHGVVCLISVLDGKIKKGDVIRFLNAKKTFTVGDVGIISPDPYITGELFAGQVGFFVASIRNVTDVRVGDTIVAEADAGDISALPGFKPAKVMVYASVFGVSGDDFDNLRAAVEKLTLNDSSVTVQKESSLSLGVGFRCGFLGLLHMDVFMERLEQEYGARVIATAPTVPYKVCLRTGEEIDIDTPEKWPDPHEAKLLLEPMVRASIIVMKDLQSAIMRLCSDRRGHSLEIMHLDDQRILMKYTLPLGEIVVDFYDRLKELSSGYASVEYEDAGYEQADLVKVSILINKEEVEPLSLICHRSTAYENGRLLVTKLKNAMDRQLFEIIIQAAVGSKILARERLAPLRKDVTAKCYGGDITRKRKLLEKQKEGKKRMKRIGNVDLSQEVFFTVLRK